MAKADARTYAKSLELYEKLVATNPTVRRKGDTMPYTSLNGNMFSLLAKDGRVILRLAAADREAFIKKYKSQLPEMYGTVMKEYVEVPVALLKKTAELQKYFELSFGYAGSLKPKATKKKAPAKKR